MGIEPLMRRMLAKWPTVTGILRGYYMSWWFWGILGIRYHLYGNLIRWKAGGLGSLFSNKARLSLCSRWRCSCKWELIRLAWDRGISCSFSPCGRSLCWSPYCSSCCYACSALFVLNPVPVALVVIASCFPLSSQSHSTLTRSNWATWRQHKNLKQMHVKSWIFVKTWKQMSEGSVCLLVIPGGIPSVWWRTCDSNIFQWSFSFL